MRRLGLFLLLLAGCAEDPTLPRREFVPEMVDSVAYDSWSPNPVTRDGKTLLAPPRGTVARGQLPFRYLAGKEEAERAGRELVNPVLKTPEALARGAKSFAAFCFPCHGPGGQGDGPVVPPFPPPPSLLAEHARGLPDGQLFHIMSRGQGLMPSHAPQLSQDDRWKLVLHLRALQAPLKVGANP